MYKRQLLLVRPVLEIGLHIVEHAHHLDVGTAVLDVYKRQAEYIPNSRLCEMPQEMIQKLYEAAKSKGGSTKLEFEGDIGKNDFQNPQDVMNPDATGEGNISDVADVAGAGAENAPGAATGAEQETCLLYTSRGGIDSERTQGGKGTARDRDPGNTADLSGCDGRGFVKDLY